MLLNTLKEIKRASATQGVLENYEIINYINRYLHNDFMTDVSMFALRKYISFEPVHKDSDCYIPNNTTIRSVTAIKEPIASLASKLSAYTNRSLYSAVDNAYEIDGYLYNTFSAQRESEFFKLGNTVMISNDGCVSDISPFVLQGEALTRMSNYWTRVAIYDGLRKITSLVFDKVISSKSLSSNGFNAYIDFNRRTLTVSYTGNKQATFNVRVETFESTNGLLIKDNAIFGRQYISHYNGYNDGSIFLDALIYPLLLYGVSDSLDELIRPLINIVTLGTANIISFLLCDSAVQQSVAEKYEMQLDKYQNMQKDADGLEFLNQGRVSDPLYGSDLAGFGYNYGWRI